MGVGGEAHIRSNARDSLAIALPGELEGWRFAAQSFMERLNEANPVVREISQVVRRASGLGEGSGPEGAEAVVADGIEKGGAIDTFNSVSVTVVKGV